MAASDDKLNEVGTENGPAFMTRTSVTTNRGRAEQASEKLDHAQALTQAITMALKQRGSSESDIVNGIGQRAELYEKSVAQGRHLVGAAVATGTTPGETTYQSQELRTADIEVLPPEMVEQLAVLDARHYRKLRDPQDRAQAALAMGQTARFSAAYRATLAEKAPNVASIVATVMAVAEKISERKTSLAGGEAHTASPQTVNEHSPTPPMQLDPTALARVFANRARDIQTVAEQLGLNSIEQVSQRKKETGRDAQSENGRAAPKQAVPIQAKVNTAGPADNQVAADEIFTASGNEAKPIVPAEVEDKYLRVGDTFYHPKNTTVVAFEDKGNKLETRSNSEQIATTMVTIARARGWDEIKVSGSETFRREVWLEAAAHGMQVKGYTPSEVDKAELAKRTSRHEMNRVPPRSALSGRDSASHASEPTEVRPSRTDTTDKAHSADRAARADKPSQRADVDQRARAFTQQPAAEAIIDHPELAGTYAAIASMRKKAAADRLSAKQRAVVMARIESNVVNSIERGELPTVKVREEEETRRQRAVDKESTR